jgi:hypothetical protein
MFESINQSINVPVRWNVKRIFGISTFIEILYYKTQNILLQLEKENFNFVAQFMI